MLFSLPWPSEEDGSLSVETCQGKESNICLIKENSKLLFIVDIMNAIQLSLDAVVFCETVFCAVTFATLGFGLVSSCVYTDTLVLKKPCAWRVLWWRTPRQNFPPCDLRLGFPCGQTACLLFPPLLCFCHVLLGKYVRQSHGCLRLCTLHTHTHTQSHTDRQTP